MVSVISFSYLFFICLSLFITGRFLKDFTIGILGGFGIFLLGFYVLSSPLVGVEVWFSNVIGSILFGLGAYIWIRGSIDWVDISR